MNMPEMTDYGKKETLVQLNQEEGNPKNIIGEEIEKKKRKVKVKIIKKNITRTQPNSPNQNSQMRQSSIQDLVLEGNENHDIDNNRYVKADLIGSGAYGKVYQGLDTENGQIIAIKTIELPNRRPEQMAREIKAIRNEIQALK